MDGALLQMFTDAARDRLVGRDVGPVRWCRPLLSVALAGRGAREYLTVILESPGPFCFLSRVDPLQGAPVPARFPQLEGATITGIARPAGERILRIEALSAGETGEPVVLNALVFGSAGRVELVRADGTLAQYVGGRLERRVGAAPRRKEDIPEGRFYLVSRERLGRVAPVHADDPSAAHRLGPFEDAVIACEQVGALIVAGTHDRIVRHRMKPLTRRMAARRKLLEKLDADCQRADGHHAVRREAEILAAYQTTIEPGAKSVELPDAYDPGRTVRIELDPSQPVRSQIEKRFKRAAKLERSRAHTQRRIAEVRAELEALERVFAAVAAASGFAAALEEIERLAQAHSWYRLPAGTVESRRPDAPGVGQGVPFRRFDLNDMWFVLVGRNNRENDELTFHSAAPSDLWFHAQHVAGSHAILKSRGSPGAPPPRVLEAAAAIAAFFSKSKHSGLVPVIYTQRKYVRKFRGARPGQVVCEREKMIMVAPGLPGNHTPQS